MKVTSSYAVHVQDHRQSLKATVSLYRAAVAFMIDVVDKEWDTLPPICAAGGKLGQHALEHMIHKTKGFPKPKYNFDEKFYKFPSYFRRAAITMALGAVSSYRKNLANWEAGGKQGRPPKLAYDRNVMPVFFRGNMSECESMLQGETTVVQLKLFVKKRLGVGGYPLQAPGCQVSGQVVERRQGLCAYPGGEEAQGPPRLQFPAALCL